MKDTIVSNLSDSLGQLESQILSTVSRLGKPGITLQEAFLLAPDLSRRSVREAFVRLERKAKLIRVARSRYFLPNEEPAAVACQAFPPSYVSFLTVLHDAGFTEQIPRRLDLAYARIHLRHFSWQGLPIHWHPIPPSAFLGYRQKEPSVLEATIAKASADLVHRQKDFGGLEPYRAIVAKSLRDTGQTEYDEAAAAYAERPTTLRRILYLRYPDGMVPPNLLRLLEKVDLHNPVQFDVVRPSKAKPIGGILKIRDGRTA